MSGVVLLDKKTTLITLDVLNAKEFNASSNTLLFEVYGIGTTFTATIDIYPVFGGNAFSTDKMTLSISNATPSANTVITTPHRKYVAAISALTGSAEITALVEA